MITVSDAFKENIKKNVRQLNGFVELIVGRASYFRTNPDYQIGIQASSENKATEVISGELNSVIDDKSIMYKYASLESNRLLLDGSFVLPSKNYNNKNCGYISNSVDGTGSLKITSSAVSLSVLVFKNEKKITIYFEEGYATNFTVKIKAYYSSNTSNYIKEYTYTISNNTKEQITIDFSDIENTIIINNDEYKYITVMEINVDVSNWSIENRRVRIRQINVGETILFENQDIIEMNVNEQTSFDNTDMPNNDFNVTLDNYDRKFNILNNNSVLNRLSTISAIHPYIGVSLNEGTTEYVNMGAYHFGSYQDNQDKTITLYGEGAKNRYEKEDNYLLPFGNDEQIASEVLNSMNVASNLKYDGVIELKRTNTNNQREQLQAIAIFTSSYIKETRTYNQALNNILSMEKILSIPLKEISLLEQIKEPEITRENKIEKIKINNFQIGILDATEKILLEDSLNIGDPTIVRINSGNPIDISSLKIYLVDEQNNQTLITNTSLYYEVYNSYFNPRIEIYGLTNSNYTGIKVLGKEYNKTEKENVYGNTESGFELEYNNEYITQNFHNARIVNYILNNQKDYHFKVEFNGDPSLEIGDAIIFETVEGNMIGNIEKINLTYNGGLQETIEGECNSVL